MLKVQVHRRVLGTYFLDYHCIIANPFRNQHSPHDNRVPVSEYETWAHLFVAKLQLMEEYHSCSGTPQIGIPECWRLRHGSGIHGEAAPFAAGYVLAIDSSSGTTEIYNPVQNGVLGFLWGQLWQAATNYECLIPGQARLKCDSKPLKRMFPTSYCTFYFSLLHSHHVFFGFESVDTVHIDCHLSRHCTFRCRRLIPLALC